MKRNKLGAILCLIIFCIVSSNLLYPRPKNCSTCWLKFKNSSSAIILPFEKADNNTYMISLKNLRTELEKARIGDRLIVDLKLGKAKVIKMGTHSPRVIRIGETILEQYNSMGKISCLLPKGMRLIPASGQLIVRDDRGKFKSEKYVQLR